VNDDGSGGMTLRLAAIYGVSAERIRSDRSCSDEEMKKVLVEYA
jgi:hypothetical protein